MLALEMPSVVNGKSGVSLVSRVFFTTHESGLDWDFRSC